MPRFHSPEPLSEGLRLALAPGAARHVQVLRLQPGAAITLFDGRGGEFQAVVLRMGRSEVEVEVGAHAAVEREAAVAVHLAVGMPANERMDWLVEKAAELGVASIQPLLAERSVLRLAGERAQKKQAHWQGVAVAACEQCGRNRVPVVHGVRGLKEWVEEAQATGFVLSLSAAAVPLDPSFPRRREPRASALEAREALGPRLRGDDEVDPRLLANDEAWLLSGPEGGLSPAEEQSALARGWTPVHLGPRILRAETAPLAALALLTLGPP